MGEFIRQAQAVDFDLLRVLAGLGIFLFGIQAMSEQLKFLAGSKMKSILDKYTSNSLMGVFVGAFVTGLIQSSSGTTALTISLVRSGLLNLKQAIGIIMGANIGTTVTAILIGFNISIFAPYFIVVGAFALMFVKKNRSKYIAMLMLAFGLMFFGLDMMGSSLKVLAKMPLFSEFAVQLSNNKFAGVGLGLVMTLAIQSSSATIGILQSLYSDGLIDLQGTLPILFGDNIGTTITAVLASVGGSIAAKRAAAAHVSFNIIGTIIFMAIFPVFYNIVVFASDTLGLTPKMQVAFAHAFFNISTTIIMLPFIGLLVKLVTFLIKDSKEELEDLGDDVILEPGLINESPQLAITLAYQGATQMATRTLSMLKYTKRYINTKSDKAYDQVIVIEDGLNELNREISEYLVEISSRQIDDKDSILLNNLFYNIKDLERLGDHSVNIVNHFQQIYNAKEELSPIAITEVSAIYDNIDSSIRKIIKVLDNPNIDLCNEILENKVILSKYCEDYVASYLKRYQSKERMGANASMLYSDIISDFERMGDYCYNISNRASKVLVS